MSNSEVKRALEAILMVVDEPISEVILAQIIERPTEEIRSALLELADSYQNEERGFELKEIAGEIGRAHV